MKKQSVANSSYTIRQSIVSAILGCFLLLASSTTLTAQNKNDSPIVQVVYAGLVDQKPVFRISFENAKQEAFTLLIRDDQGTVLYAENFQAARFRKSFLISDIELDLVKLSFVINPADGKQPQVYEINKKSLSVDEYIITKL